MTLLNFASVFSGAVVGLPQNEKNEACQDLLKKGDCRYFLSAHRVRRAYIDANMYGNILHTCTLSQQGAPPFKFKDRRRA